MTIINPAQADIINQQQDPLFFSSLQNFIHQNPKPYDCQGCKYFTANFAVDDYPDACDVLILFPNPSKADITPDGSSLKGAFQSKNWWLFRKILGKAEYETGLKFKKTYACLCRQTGSPPASILKYCSQNYLKKKLKLYKPKVILAMGITAAKGLGFKECMRDLRGTIKDYEDGEFSCKVVFTYDPSQYFYSVNDYVLLSTFELDLRKTLIVAQRKYNPVNWEVLKKKLLFPKTYSEIKSVLEPLIDFKGILAFDIETTGLDPRAEDACITTISFAWGKEDACAFSLSNANKQTWALVKKVLEGPTRKVAHNAKFDVGYLFGKEGIWVNNLYSDTMLNHHAIDENRAGGEDERTIRGEYTLKKLTWDFVTDYGGYELHGDVSKILRKEGDASKIDEDALLMYAAIDSLVTWKLDQKQFWLLNENKKKTKLFELTRTLLIDAIYTLVKLENRGVHLDMKKLDQMIQQAEKSIKDIEKEFYDLVDSIGLDSEEHNIRSTKDLQKILFEELQLPVIKKSKKTNAPSTDISTLTALEDKHPIVNSLINFRKLEKLKSSFLENWKKAQRDGVIYPNYRLEGTKTGRLSCTQPNVQQVPRKGSMLPGYDLKKLFIPKPGSIMIGADYAQQEVRVLAMYCKEGRLVDALKEGLDIHSYICSEAFNIPYEEILKNKNKEPYYSMRNKSKNLTFALLYGGNEHTLFERYNIPLNEGKQLFNNFYSKFPEVKKYNDDSHTMAKIKGYVDTFFSRRRRFPVLKWSKWGANKSLRQAQNARIQSTASDICVDAVTCLNKKLEELGGGVLLTVHDSIISEVPFKNLKNALNLYIEIMKERPSKIYSWACVPLDIDLEIGFSWGDLKALPKKKDLWDDFIKKEIMDVASSSS